MVAGLVPVLIDTARAVLDRVLPDPAERARAELELLKAQAEGTFEQKAAQALALGQIDTNKAEASADVFRGGWRPFVGWVCGLAFAQQYVVWPTAAWIAAAVGHPLPPMPTLDGVLWELLFGLLGLGTLRSVEKIKGRA